MKTSFLKIPVIGLWRSLIIAMLFSLVVELAGIASAKTVSTPSVMEITFNEDLISAELVDAPLLGVLQRLKQEFGFKAHFHGDLTELITLSFNDLPLDKSLQQLTANHSLSVAYLSTTKAPEQNEVKQIAEVWVLSRSAISKSFTVAPVASVLPSAAPVDEAVEVKEEATGLAADEEQEGVPLAQIMNDPDAKRSNQQQAIKKLAAVGDAASVLTMAEFLGNEDREVRQLLVNGISSVQNEEATQVLGQVLQNESDPEIRKIVVRALGQRKEDAAAQVFLGEAINDGDEEVKNLAEQLLTQ